LLAALPHVGFRDLHAAVYLGLAANFLLAHIGELLRATAVARGHGAPVSVVLASVVMERVLDFLAILAILAMVVVAAPGAPEAIVSAAAASAAFVALSVAGLVLFLHPPEWAARFAARCGRRLRPKLHDRLARHFARFKEGLAPLTRPGLMAITLCASVVQWGLVVVAVWASGMAVAESVTTLAAIVTFVLLILGMTLPNSPLQVGTTQLAFVIGLGTAGIAASVAIAASLVYTMFLILPIMLAGALAALRGQPDRGRGRPPE
jgi:uncharacterized protein (TIRG00374 family)